MSFEIDLSTASSEQIEKALCKRLENIRLIRNITRAQLASQAGISQKTLARLEKGEGVTLDTFIRVLTALGVQENFAGLLPDPSIRPVERIQFNGKVRKRARPGKPISDDSTWCWGDEHGKMQR